MKKNVVKPVCFFALITLLVSWVEGAQVCEWRLNTCPENINNKVIKVPSNVISLSSRINFCNPTEIFEISTVASDTPAIMFVIDNSTSMTRGTGVGRGNDVDGTRFTVTKDLLDTISKTQPGAWVGLVVFRSGLYFDQRTHSMLVPLKGVPAVEEGYEYQAYLPPLKLDSLYMFDSTQMRGMDIIKFFLRTITVNRAVQLEYEPLFSMPSGTNINNAFEGALQGFSLLPEQIIPRDQRFIVFLSDGEPQPYNERNPDSAAHGGKHPFEFTKGTNTPTTFTVYLHNTERVPPDSLISMTQNIRNNGYSVTNPHSDIWILETNYDTLMSLFMKKIITPILSKQVGTPTFMVLNNITSTTHADSAFIFNNQFLLNKDTTFFSLNITYHMVDDENKKEYDTIRNTSFSIVRSNNVSKPSEGDIICWNRDLLLYYNGSPVTAVNETMNNLEVVFVTETAMTTVTVQVTHTNGPIQDIVSIPLTNANSQWSGPFSRSVGVPITGDRILQHLENDSIILIYRNPQNALDTLRKAYPFSISKILSFPSSYYYDNNADGYVDSIFIAVNGAVTSEDLNSLKNLIHLPVYRNFRVDSLKIVDGGLAYYVKDGSSEIKTNVTSSDIIIIDNATLPNGGIVTANIINIQDKVAPVLISGRLLSSAVGDSLQVVFSEPINVFISKSPILFSLPDGTIYHVELEAGGSLTRETQYTSKVTSVQAGHAIASNHFIWINSIAGINDKSGNIQSNPKNRKVPLTVLETPYDIVPKIINNPFKPNDEIPEVVRKAYEAIGIIPPLHGMVIVVEPQEKILRNINLQGKLSVFDVVKNQIMKDIPGVFDKQTQKLYFIWEGKNSNGRKVGTGTYTAVINISDTDKNVKKTRTLRLGVKR